MLRTAIAVILCVACATAALPPLDARRLTEAMEAHHPSSCIACCACKLYTGSEYCSAADCGDGSGGYCWSPRDDNYGLTCKGSPPCEGACAYEVPERSPERVATSGSSRTAVAPCELRLGSS